MGLFNRNNKPIPPYDKLVIEHRYALYYLLEYLSKAVPLKEMAWALQYLEKAAKYFGISKKQIENVRIFYDKYDKIVTYIKEINDKQIYEYMISNCSNIFILMNSDDEHKRLGEQAYKLYNELGFPYEDVRAVVRKYQYRTDI